jgi:CrcB protein
MSYAFIFIGGGVGALLRYLSNQLVNAFVSDKFSLGTLFVNCVGAFIIGFLINMFDTHSIDAKWKLLLITGFLGGYTTFSAYSLETAQYFLNGNIRQAVINILLNNVLCLLLVLLGMWVSRVR